ncbi:hypothetical protein [Nocardia sp. NPDC048505]|uniref:hypothetical protein n=1 Tax=unclassified Nocardia TaxID=2637762 RepID=UPI003400C26F
MTVLSSPHAPRVARSGVLLVVLALGFSAFGVGCADDGETAAVSDGTEPLGIGKEVTVPISEAAATLVSPGAEPRAVLRPSYPAGTTQQVTLRTEHRIQQQINDQPVRDFSSSPMTIPMTAQANGDGCDLTLGAVTSSDPALAKALTAADGSHAGFEFNDDGAITALRLAPSPDTSNAARAALEQAFYQAVYRSIMFPDEAVGEGAVWTVHQEVDGGVTLDQVTTATLTHREDNRLTIDLSVTQTPKSKVWSLPNNAGTLTIQDYVMQGQGTITVDLGLPLPVSGMITVGGHQAYSDPHSKSDLQQTITTQVSWTE